MPGIPHLPRPDHYHPPAGQAAPAESSQPAAPQTIQPQQNPPFGQNPGGTGPDHDIPPQHDYGFILNPEAPPKKPLLPSLNGGSGGTASALAVRVGLAAGGLVVLLILFSVVRGLVSSGPNEQVYLSVLRNQQQLIHLTTQANTGNSGSQQPELSPDMANFVATAKLSATSARRELVTSLSTGGIKINPKQLALGADPKLDAQLKAAAAADTYAPTFRDIMQAELQAYQASLDQAYDATKGSKGRQLLLDQYKQSELLQAQLAAAALN